MKRTILPTLVLVGVSVIASLGPPSAARFGTEHRIVGRVHGLGACARGTENDPCPSRRLFAIKVRLRDSDGDLVARTKTRSTGRFSFTRGPGKYSVAGVDVAGFMAPPPREVVIGPNQDDPEHVRIRFATVNGPGVMGQVTQSPTCPGPQRPGQECSAPLEGARIRVEDDNGKVVGETTTGADGYYAFPLEPGSYTLIAEGFDNQLPSPPGPITFTVGADDTGPHWRPLRYDTGIR